MTTSILLQITNAEPTAINTSIANTIVNIYMTAKSFYTVDAIQCMTNFLATGNLNFSDYNIKF